VGGANYDAKSSVKEDIKMRVFPDPHHVNHDTLIDIEFLCDRKNALEMM